MAEAPLTEPLPVVCFDESGNSGQNLLESSQPIFVLCSVRLEESIAEGIVERHRGELAELKFSGMRKSSAGRGAVAAVVEESAITPDNVFLSMALKPWMIAGKFVDLLVEPYFHARGRNMYAGDLPLKMANALYERAGLAMGEEVWRDVQTKFVAMMQRSTAEHRKAMLAALATARGACSPAEDGIAAMLDAALYFEDVTEEVYADQIHYQLDPAPAALTVHLDHWSEAIGSYRVLHDHSAAVLDWQPALEELADVSIEMVDSTAYPAVQIADVLAGALVALGRERFGARTPEAFVQKLGEGKLPSLVQWWSPPISPYWNGLRPGGGDAVLV
jgi:Protein of unknown function (DUF3800)